jgi:hypothetical protein
VLDVLAVGQVAQVEQTGVEPLLVGLLGGQLGLDLLVADDAAVGGVHEEHPAGLQATRLTTFSAGEVEDARLGGEDDQTVVGDPVAPGRRPLRSRTAPMRVPSVKVTQAGPSHGSMKVEWNS